MTAHWYRKLVGRVTGPLSPGDLRAPAANGHPAPETVGQQPRSVEPISEDSQGGDERKDAPRRAVRRPPPFGRPRVPSQHQGPPKRVILAAGAGAGLGVLLLLLLLLILLRRDSFTTEDRVGHVTARAPANGETSDANEGGSSAKDKSSEPAGKGAAGTKRTGGTPQNATTPKEVETEQHGTSPTAGDDRPAPPPPTNVVTLDPLTRPPAAEPGEAPADEPDEAPDDVAYLRTQDGSGSNSSTRNSLKSRLSGRRKALLRSGGGTPESESAVQMALKWLAAHQEPDGKWSFQHDAHPECNHQCSHPGANPSNIAATSLALLPFLGSGQTHTAGKYNRAVDLGLGYLVAAMSYNGSLGSLLDRGGRMYGHGLASIVLCEAYGMTHDPVLREPAQAAVDFIVDAQDPVGGGWRYQPKTPGDTSVVGWQVMARNSAQMAELRVPGEVFGKTSDFLDAVQANGGAAYGYTGPAKNRHPTTAIGLLCRMYLGWSREVRALDAGVQALDALGPSTDTTPRLRNNMYYNYYATQVMHHWGDEPWHRWNATMRDYLISSQSRDGHERGSWYFDGTDLGSSAGGRIYCTAMAAMILEVYYRHMPLYGKHLVRD